MRYTKKIPEKSNVIIYKNNYSIKIIIIIIIELIRAFFKKIRYDKWDIIILPREWWKNNF